MIGSAMCFIDCHLSELHRTDLESFPTIFEIVWQITLSMICEDTMFYFTHRTLHHPKLYPWIHKKHHEFYTTVSIAAEYAHPIEYAFGNVIPVFVFSKLIGSGMHLATLQFWLAMRVFETVDGHSGYEFSWSPYRLLPFSTSSEYHNYHHSHNVGNYESFFSIWDTVLGTNKSFMKHLKGIEKEDKLEKLRDQYAKQKQH
jgi:sterol desaturase/sphingolipid hydroxylase (fatty acid hydroxylase superfamily)